ncbi:MULTISPECIES: ABC transporter substrate-binding protein [unclassified Beijerinckia]|uniref:ABC transporter substrate-binding protein n=1 Tax=unclassified Beijerinckia TaxID=2638183 RepID=UPI000898261E|nr:MULTISPECIES: ABC transporter substrate-binding protein [unclassified Beijerinckia]MDH7799241.1 NitT/TauT family transport system substrate-binding protein [Beijerinckia sp. GAS462]SED90977.1 NitT/TauT family transport system substrate-binding protein [Beijerinckia sp. 28-YEA-48]
MKRPISVMIGLALSLGATLTASAQEKVTYNMAWLPQGSSVGVAVAIDRGWFKEAGLDVTMMRGYGGNRTANELDQGQYEIGYVDPVSLVLNRVNGGKIRLVGAINTHWPAGICYLKKNGQPKTLDNMKGMQLGGGSASPVHNIIPAWLEANGKPKDFISLLRLDPAVVDASLVEGKIDLAECWRASNRPVMSKQAKIAGVDLAWIEYSDYGLNAYGSGFAASEDMIAKKPDVIRKFLKSSYRGYDFARSNPDQAADIMVRMFPTLDRSVVLDQIKDINDLIADKSAGNSGLGFMRDDRIQSTMQFIDKSFDLKGKVKPADIYTNALLN